MSAFDADDTLSFAKRLEMTTRRPHIFRDCAPIATTPLAPERTRIQPGSVAMFEGDYYEIKTEDGLAVVWDYCVMVAVDGADYIHPRTFEWKNEAADFIALVEAEGSVDLTKWILQEPGPTLEERLGPGGIEWELEQMDRLGSVGYA
jgi:hypothetical protein